ncbi:MAG: DEAD/DEAH box helicase [Bacteroidia bacterium]
MRFDEFPLDPTLLDGIHAIGFENTTPIQAQAIPVILEGRDLIACAQTGTGKTAAFTIPLVEKILAQEAGKTRCLIIVPTRELAMQIDQAIEGLAYFTGVYSVPVYGGNQPRKWEQQKKALEEGVDIIIATPGRFKMQYQLGFMDLSGVQMVVLDEADKMLDMGFYEDIIEIIKNVPSKRQTLMFSATMPPKIRTLAKAIMNPDPAEITLALAKPAEGVSLEAYVVYDAQKVELLDHLIKQKSIESMIIFASSKASVDKITSRLKKKHIDARAIHSDRDQQERMATLTAFKNKQFPIVVATDVLARGIDIDNLSHVLNYDVPTDAEDYVHRIGRTARANTTGEAITFISPDDMYRFGKIETLIEREVPKIDAPKELGETPRYNPKGGRSDGGRRSPGRNGNGGGGDRRRSGGDDKSRSRGDRRGGGGNRKKQSGDNSAEGSQQPRRKNRKRNRNRNKKQSEDQ